MTTPDYMISQLSAGTPAPADLFPFLKVGDHTTAPAGAHGSDQVVTMENLWTTLVGTLLNNRGAIAASTAYNPGDVVAYNGQHVLITQATTSSAWTSATSPPSLTSGTYMPVDGMGVWYASDWGVKADSGTTDNGPLLNKALARMWGTGSGGFLVLPPGNLGATIQTKSTVVIPPYCILAGQGIEGSVLKMAGSLNGGTDADAVQFMEYNSSSQATILSAATGITIAATSLQNAFYAGLMNLCVDANLDGQAATAYCYGVNMTTSPQSSTAASDPDFDPTNILLNVEVRGASGDGIWHYGRGQLRVTNCVSRYNNGWGAVPSFDSIYTGNNFAENGIGGIYIAWAACDGTANKSYNNGQNAQWVSGTAYTEYTPVMYSGQMYVAKANVTSATPPSSDTTNWAHITSATAPQYWGYPFVWDGVSESVWSACDAQENSAGDYYLHDCTGVRVSGISDDPNFDQATSTQNSSNPSNYASVTLDGTTGCQVDVVASVISAGGVYPVRVLNASTKNDVRLTGDTAVTAVASPDSLTLPGSGNSISWNGASVTGFLLYNQATATYYALLPDVTVAPAGVPALGGFGDAWVVAGPTTNTGAAILQVSNNAGTQELRVQDNGLVETADNTLDDGSGNASTAGVHAHAGGTDTSGTATASVPTFTTGVAKQLSTTQDVMLYITVVTSVSTTLAIGPTSTPANTIFAAKSLVANTILTFRIPKGWYVKITATIADYAFLQVTC